MPLLRRAGRGLDDLAGPLFPAPPFSRFMRAAVVEMSRVDTVVDRVLRAVVTLDARVG